MSRHFRICLELDLHSLVTHDIANKKEKISLRQLCQKRVVIISQHAYVVWHEIGDDTKGRAQHGELCFLSYCIAHGQKHINHVTFYKPCYAVAECRCYTLHRSIMLCRARQTF